MKHRFYPGRMRFLVIVSLACMSVILLRIIQIQILRHEYYAVAAKRQSVRRDGWPARRGSILDRHGFPLAVTRQTYTIGVTPRHVPAADPAAVELIAEVSSKRQSEIRRLLRGSEEYVPLARKVPLTCEQEVRLSAMNGVKLDPDPDRLNPFECIAPALVGAVGADGVAGGGVELAFDGYLRGEDGWLLVNRDARDRTYIRAGTPGRQPKNGLDIYLTIDSRIQAIVDFELERAVSRFGAASGAAVVMDPHSGDVLALAEKTAASGPRSDPARSLFSTSCIFEPGSTFKLLTCAFLIDTEVAGPYDSFYGEQGQALFPFGRFRDDRAFGWLSLRDAFKYSSNICIIKAISAAERERFYSFLLACGFGVRTGIDLPAESPGTLRAPSAWSNRSMASIAIGQEIGVTVMQLAMAYCAVANGGDLMVPRIATKVRDERGRIVQEFPPIRVRRVMSQATAATMREFCRDVVSGGTGAKAAVDGLSVGGKTGTAQVSDGRKYVEGKWVASFAGFVPAEDPRLVCLVVLNEPAQSHHYGSSSSAVVFGEIIEGINISSDLLAGADTRTEFDRVPRGGMVEVPSFFRLSSSAAVRLAATSGLDPRFSSDEGVVYAQNPAPGVQVGKGTEVVLSFMAAPHSAGTVDVPDLRGLSLRQARRMLLENGLRSTVDGSGTVRRQEPPAGRNVARGSVVSIYCAPGAPSLGRTGGYADGRARG